MPPEYRWIGNVAVTDAESYIDENGVEVITGGRILAVDIGPFTDLITFPETVGESVRVTLPKIEGEHHQA